MPTPDHFTHRSPKALAVSFSWRYSPSASLAPSAQAGSVARAPSLLAGCTPVSTGPAVKKLQRMLARLGYPVQGRRPVRAAHGDDGAHAARRRRARPLGARHEALPQRAQARPARRPRRPALARHPPPARRRAGQGRACCSRTTLTKLGYPAATDGAFGPATRHERAPVRARGRPARRRRAHAARGAHAQEGRPLGRHGRRGVAAHDAVDHDGDHRRRPPRRRADAEPADRADRPAAAGRRARSAPTASRSPPAGAPAAVVAIIQAGNVIAHMPVPLRRRAPELAGHGLRLLGLGELRAPRRRPARQPRSPRTTSTPGASAGPGQWVTIYAKDDHAYMVVAGLRYDTSASKGGGSRWTAAGRRARPATSRATPPVSRKRDSASGRGRRPR